MKKIAWLLMLTLTAYTFSAEEIKRETENVKYALNYYKISSGNESDFEFDSSEILSKKFWDDLVFEDYRVVLRDSKNQRIFDITLQKEAKRDISIQFQTEKSDFKARFKMAQWLTDSTKMLNDILKGYEVTKEAGEVALMSLPPQGEYHRIFFIRRGVVVRIRFTGGQSEMRKLAKLIDDKIISAHKTISEQNKK